MEGHHGHSIGDGAFQQAAARGQRALGFEIEAAFPVGIFQVLRVGGGVAQIEQLPAFRTQQQRKVSGSMPRRGKGADAGNDLSFAIDQLYLVA
jgi:hypothetical protein